MTELLFKIKCCSINIFDFRLRPNQLSCDFSFSHRTMLPLCLRLVSYKISVPQFIHAIINLLVPLFLSLCFLFLFKLRSLQFFFSQFWDSRFNLFFLIVMLLGFFFQFFEFSVSVHFRLEFILEIRMLSLIRSCVYCSSAAQR